MQVHLKRVCICAREHMYVIARVVWCEKLGVRLSVYSSLNPALHWHVFKTYICLSVVVCHSV